MFVVNKFIIKMFLTSNHCFRLCPLSTIRLSPVKKGYLIWIRREICTSLVYKQKQSKTVLYSGFFRGGSVIKFLQICSDEETNSSTCIAWGWVHFQQVFFFGWTIIFKGIIGSLLRMVKKINKKQIKDWAAKLSYAILAKTR